jgi:hypothetical protein
MNMNAANTYFELPLVFLIQSKVSQGLNCCMLHANLRIEQQALESEQTTGFTKGILKVMEKIILIICNITVYCVLLLLEH